MTGTKLEPLSPPSGVQGPPSLQKVFPWGLEEGAWDCAHRQRFRIVSERKRRGSGVPRLLPAGCVTVGELLYSPEPQFPCLKFSDKSLCFTEWVWQNEVTSVKKPLVHGYLHECDYYFKGKVGGICGRREQVTPFLYCAAMIIVPGEQCQLKQVGIHCNSQ